VRLRQDNSPAISLDGSTIAFPGVDSAGTIGLYVRSLDRDLPVSLEGEKWDPNSPFFSPDGRSIGFLVSAQMRKIALTGGTITPITPALGSWSLGSWGANDVIVFGLSGSLWQVPSGGGAHELILARDSTRSESYGAPHFLPDGRNVLLELVDSAGAELLIASTSGGSVRRLGIEGRSPHYVDGGWLVYVIENGTVMAAPFDLGSLSVTGNALPVTTGVTVNTHARIAVSRSGTIVHYSTTAEGDRELVLVRRDGTVESLGLPLSRYRSPRFSPDGRRVAVLDGGSAEENRGGDIWVLDLESRRFERLTPDGTASAPSAVRPCGGLEDFVAARRERGTFFHARRACFRSHSE
jgi:Tol biopolymer transport system component